MEYKYTKEEFLNKIHSIKDENTRYITKYYDITSRPDKITHLVSCMKNISYHYIYEYNGYKCCPDLSRWQILYNNILIEILFDYDDYSPHSGLSLFYLENDINEGDIDTIINTFSFLQPIYKHEYKSKTRQEIEEYKIEMNEKEKKRVEEMIENHEKKRALNEKKRQDIISNGNWYDYIKNYNVKR
jgi:hypothetical protein